VQDAALVEHPLGLLALGRPLVVALRGRLDLG
jgi:hypothetical protein